jgi:hypothetical protein
MTPTIRIEWCDFRRGRHLGRKRALAGARARGHSEDGQSFAERISFSQHNVFNPRIEVNGNAAHGRWNFLGPFTFRKGNRQIWLAAFYEDDFVRVGGVWRA